MRQLQEQAKKAIENKVQEGKQTWRQWKQEAKEAYEEEQQKQQWTDARNINYVESLDFLNYFFVIIF